MHSIRDLSLPILSSVCHHVDACLLGAVRIMEHALVYLSELNLPVTTEKYRIRNDQLDLSFIFEFGQTDDILNNSVGYSISVLVDRTDCLFQSVEIDAFRLDFKYCFEFFNVLWVNGNATVDVDECAVHHHVVVACGEATQSVNQRFIAHGTQTLDDPLKKIGQLVVLFFAVEPGQAEHVLELSLCDSPRPDQQHDQRVEHFERGEAHVARIILVTTDECSEQLERELIN